MGSFTDLSDSVTGLKPANGIKGYECRNATYCVSPDGKNDLLVVKEYIHYLDGRVEPSIRLIPNYVKSFWITRKAFQNHTDKLEWEPLEHLQEFKSTQANLPVAVAKALGQYRGKELNMRQLGRSVHLYGSDISTTSLIKKDYQRNNPDCVSPKARVAAFDTEADVVYGTGDVTLASLTMGNRVFTAATKDFVGRMHDFCSKVLEKAQRELKEHIVKRGLTFDIQIVENGGEAVHRVFQKAHEWQPDFVIAWNIDYDIPKSVEMLTKYGYDLADTFSDPRVPRENRFFKYKQGKSQKVTQGGKVLPLHPADRWHTATFPAGWYFVDSMCLYKRIRVAKGNLPSYSLDYVMNKEVMLGKFKIPECEHLSGLAWHVEMQSKYKIEYTVYHMFDCIGLEILDEKTGDTCMSFSILAGISDFSDFTSNPKRICDDLHYFCLERGHVICAVSDDMRDKLDVYVVDLTGHIVTLQASMMDDNGLNVIKDMPYIRSMFRGMCADLDIEGTYPTEEDLFNISKETTVRELSAIRGVDPYIQRMCGVNMTGGHTNAIEICSEIFKLPEPFSVLEMFLQDNPQHRLVV